MAARRLARTQRHDIGVEHIATDSLLAVIRGTVSVKIREKEHSIIARDVFFLSEQKDSTKANKQSTSS